MEYSDIIFGPGPLRFALADKTDRGLVRSGNEDYMGSLPEDGIFVVADGMGGYSAGEVASRIAVETILEYLKNHVRGEPSLGNCLAEAERAIEQANLAIAKAAREVQGRHGMGTTIVVGILREGSLGFAWVGDSRLYLLRDHKLIQLSTDHTLVQELVNQHLFPSVDAAIAAGVGENVLTRALGAEGTLSIDADNVDLHKGDILLFCSDGLNHMTDRRSIEKVMNTPKINLATRADHLIQLACSMGGRDNITVMLVEILATGD